MAAICLLAAVACNGSTGGPEPRPEAVPVSNISELSAEANGTSTCGDFEITWRSPELGGDGPPAELSVADGDRTVLELKGADDIEQLEPLWCGDATGDGAPELAAQTYTGGAHCCYRFRLDTLGGDTLLEADLGNAGGPTAQQLDGRGPLEIVTFSDVLAYFDVPFAASPFLPLVFAYRDGAYVRATADYPDHVRASLAKAVQTLEEAAGRTDIPEAAQGAALGVYGHWVLLGEPERGLVEIAEHAPEEVTEWVRERADRAAEAVRSGRRGDDG